MQRYQNTVYVQYRLLQTPPTTGTVGTPGISLELRPAMDLADHAGVDPSLHAVIDGAPVRSVDGGRFALPEIEVDGDHPTFEFFPERQERINYRWEAARGYEAFGTLWSPGRYKVGLHPDVPATLVASTETWETMGAIAPADAWRYENERRARLLRVADGAQEDFTTAELVLAADQFVIAPAGRLEDAARARATGEELRTVVAGYHWFTDWGRDTDDQP